MPEVSVDSGFILRAKKLCVSAEKEMKGTITLLNEEMNSISAGWKDQKAKDFEEIVKKCILSLKQPLEELHRCDSYLQRLAQAIKEYESTSFLGLFDATVNSSSSLNELGNTNVLRHGVDEPEFANGNVFQRIIGGLTRESKDIYKALKTVEYNPIQPASFERTEQQIIGSISGGDMTEGSCSSLALAYVGNRAGYIVYDFRDGQSRNVFSRRSSIEQIAHLPNVNSCVISNVSSDDCYDQVVAYLEQNPNREYYLAAGRHAAIIRNTGRTYQYLELQSGDPGRNGWQSFTYASLANRFAYDNSASEWDNYLIDIESLQSNNEFLNLLGYINTDEYAQIRGDNGYER